MIAASWLVAIEAEPSASGFCLITPFSAIGSRPRDVGSAR